MQHLQLVGMFTVSKCAVACLASFTISSCISNPSTDFAPYWAARQDQSPTPHPMSRTLFPGTICLRVCATLQLYHTCDNYFNQWTPLNLLACGKWQDNGKETIKYADFYTEADFLYSARYQCIGDE